MRITLAFLAACAVPTTEPPTTIAGPYGTCPAWICGANSPIVDAYAMHDLSLLGRTNAGGLALSSSGGRARIWSAGHREYDLDLQGGRLVGTSPNFPILEGPALKGAYLLLLREDKPAYWIYIASVAKRQFLAGPTPGADYEAYTLTWSLHTNGPAPDHNVCSAPLSGVDEPELLGLAAGETVLFRGDRIDAIAKTFTEYDRSWFNLGCAGHTLAKLALTGFVSDYDAIPGPDAGDQAGMQAALKMYVADYCGTGTAYTVQGQPLVYKDALGYVDYFAPPDQYEARWTSSGATCLTRPRIPELANEIAHACELPDCNGDGTFVDFDGADRISASSAP